MSIVRGASDALAVLSSAHTIAMVGASSNEWRASYHVMAELLGIGYEVVPVNPREEAVHGRRSYASLAEAAADHRIDMVDVFRRPEACPPIAAQAVAIGARILWLQLGIVSEEAADIATAAGLVVVMDDCPSRYVAALGSQERRSAP